MHKNMNVLNSKKVHSEMVRMVNFMLHVFIIKIVYSVRYLYVKNSFSYLLNDDEIDKVVLKTNIDSDGGSLLIYLGDEIIYKDKVYITKKINLWNKIKNFFNSLF